MGHEHDLIALRGMFGALSPTPESYADFDSVLSSALRPIWSPDAVESIKHELKEAKDRLATAEVTLRHEVIARDVAHKAKTGAYEERDRLVALVAHLALAMGWPAGLGRHEGEDWDDDWRNVVYIDLPTGQASWHIHDSELPLFDGLPQYAGSWDRHTNKQKYERLARLDTDWVRGFIDGASRKGKRAK